MHNGTAVGESPQNLMVWPFGDAPIEGGIWSRNVTSSITMTRPLDPVSLSRRGFLQGAAATAAGAAGLAATGHLVSACDSDNGTPSTHWDRTTDVVVLGSGTGLLAAARAAHHGLKVLVLEKGEILGGTTAVSGGGIWVPNNYVMAAAGISDSRAEALQYLAAATFGQGNVGLHEAYVDTANTVVDYLRSLGIEWVNSGMFQDYYPALPGAKNTGRQIGPVSTLEGYSMGAYLIKVLADEATAKGAEILLETTAKRLVKNGDGAVEGVLAEQKDGTEIAIRADLGVIVATGGIDHDAELALHYLRGPIYFSMAAATDSGDGQRMGQLVGADLRNMNECWGAPGYHNTDTDSYLVDWGFERGRPGAIIVNRAGARFCNESSSYDAIARSFYAYDNGRNDWRNIPAFTIVDAEHRHRYTLGYQAPDAVTLPSWIKSGATLSELATKLGIDPEGLEATVAAFNTHAAKGQDPLFKRGESYFDTSTCGDAARTELANICLAPLATAPFYGVAIYPGTIGTCGGLRIDRDARVLNPFGDVIPGLYAVGNASGSLFGAGYPGGGATVGAGMVMGYRAVEHLAAQVAE